MPYVNVQFGGKLSTEQKRELSNKISTALQDVTGKPKDYTYVVFQEVERENWGVGDQLLSDFGTK